MELSMMEEESDRMEKNRRQERNPAALTACAGDGICQEWSSGARGLSPGARQPPTPTHALSRESRGGCGLWCKFMDPTAYVTEDGPD